MYLPDICDVPASGSALSYAAPLTLDTSADALCNEIIDSTAGLPQICVIRAPSITVAADLRIRGTRTIAFVADDEVFIQGTVDASAVGAVAGPGGAVVSSGSPTTLNNGGGGAGFLVAGAAGGGASDGAGNAGGAAADPLPPSGFRAGARGPQAANMFTAGGLGGGGVMVIACRGAVTVSGTIDVGGGGGGPGYDKNDFQVGTIALSPAGGGGSGGYVILQGLHVNTSTASGMFANGGGGGGGCSTDNCVGTAGQSGQRSGTAATGGPASGSGGAGGNGGTNAPPTVGKAAANSPGGGGGSAGFLVIAAPANGEVLAQGSKSPALRPQQMLNTR